MAWFGDLLILRTIQAWDRFRLRRLQRRHPGLEIHPDASSNLANARFELAPGARLEIGAGVVVERERGGVRFHLGADAQVSIGPGTWLRSQASAIRIFAYPGARIRLGRDCFLNGCMLSAKQEILIGDRAMIGMGSRVFDSDQHDMDLERSEVTEPVTIGDHVWVAADVTILRGVTIGASSVVGTRSLVMQDVPPNRLVAGSPAVIKGEVGDRSRVPQ